MSRMIFVNLAVADVARATAFYAAIGARKDETICKGDQASMMSWSDTVHFMLLDKAFYATFTAKQIADSRTTSEAMLCLSASDRGEVDAIAAAALGAGGREARAPQDSGFMYGRAFEDPDGHILEVMWMDVDAAVAAMAPREAEPV